MWLLIMAILLADAVAGQQVGTKFPLNNTYMTIPELSRTDWPGDMKLDTTQKAGGERDASLMIYVSSLLWVASGASDFK